MSIYQTNSDVLLLQNTLYIACYNNFVAACKFINKLVRLLFQWLRDVL